MAQVATTDEGLALEQLVEDFIRDLGRREMSEKTIRCYRHGCTHLLRFLADLGCVRTDQLARTRLEAWQESLKPLGLKPATRALYCSAVRRLLGFAARHELIDFRLTLAVIAVRVPPRLPRPIPEGDFDKVAAYLERPATRRTLKGLRDRALFWYLVTTGARVSEALQLTRQEAPKLVGSEPAVAYVRQKGGSERLLMCPASVVAMITEYLAARTDRSPWLWITLDSNHPHGQLGPEGVREIWRSLARRTGTKSFTTHQTRHTDATRLLAADVPGPAISEHLGHRDPRALANYAQVNIAQRQRAVDAMEKLVRTHTAQRTRPNMPAEPAKPVVRPPLSPTDAWAIIASSL